MRTLVFEPLIPMSLWAVLAALSGVAGLVYVLYRPPEIGRARRIVVAVLWYLGVACPLALLLNPSWLATSQSEKGRPRLRVLVDTSESMATADVDGGPRLSRVTVLAEAASRSLASDFEVELLAFDESVRPVTAAALGGLKATGQVTAVAGALTQTVQEMGQSAGAVLLLSDGAENASDDPSAPGNAAGLAKALGVPLFTVTSGSTSSGKDLSIEASSPRELAFAGQKLTVTAFVRHRGFAGAVVQAALSDGQRQLEQKDVELGAAQRASVSFEVAQDKPGVYLYELEVGSSPEEITRLNNRATFVLTVVKDAIRVLVLEGKPYWDSKFLLRVLARDKAVAVTGVIRLTDKRLLVRREPGQASEAPAGAGTSAPQEPQQAPEKVEIVSDASSFLADPERLRDYQIIILGRDTETFLTQAGVANLKQWVAETGGTLLCARGKPTQVVSERLDPVMPVSWIPGTEKRLRVQLTPFGESLRWFPDAPAEVEGTIAEKMPSLATSSTVRETKPLASVVAKADPSSALADMPVITYQPYGSGRTIVLEGAGIWRWAFLSPKFKTYQNVYGFFWGSLLRWMVSSTDFLPSQTCALRTSRPVFTTREKVVIFALLRSQEQEFNAANPPVVELTQGEKGQPIALTVASAGREAGLFRVVAGPLEQGYYEVRLRRQTAGPPAECVFQVQAPFEEQIDVAARPALMARLAEDSGGVDLTGKDLGQLRSAYMDYWLRTHPTETRHTSAWDKVWVMMIAVAIWSVAWVVRRRGGLI